MAQTLFERMGGTYLQEGDYLIPDLIAPEAPHIGVCGERRRQYLLNYRKTIYTGMLLSGKLNTHLEEIDRFANEMFSRLVDDMARREGITEKLKAENQMKWIGHMNSIRNQVEEIVIHNLICT